MPEDFDPGDKSLARKLGRALGKRLNVRFGDDGIHLADASRGEGGKVKRWRIAFAADEAADDAV